MKVGLVVIGRLENRYAVEFVDYYKKLGFDNIIIIDNNYDDEEHFEDVLQSYIDEQFVIIYNYRNIKSDKKCDSIQVKAYNEVIDKYNDEFDYLMFVDFDEYLCFTQDNNIKEYLSRNIKKYDLILINWMVMTDNDLLYDDGRPLIERFTKPLNPNGCASICTHNHFLPENWFVKPILKCKRKDVLHLKSPHIIEDNFKPGNRIRMCNNKFKIVYYYDVIEYNCIKCDHTLAYIKHFCTKTLDEYVKNKMKKCTPDRPIKEGHRKYNLEFFFKINVKTKEKIEYLEKNNINNYIIKGST